MKSPIKKLKDTAQRKSQQRAIMGKDETHRQEREQLRAEQTGGIAKAAAKRVGEYKKAKKMAKGGLCRGGGAATRGLKYKG